MIFLPKCRAKEFRMLFTILDSFCSFLDWEEADIQPKMNRRKIPVFPTRPF